MPCTDADIATPSADAQRAHEDSAAAGSESAAAHRGADRGRWSGVLLLLWEFDRALPTTSRHYILPAPLADPARR
jgi:hypothetical protein